MSVEVVNKYHISPTYADIYIGRTSIRQNGSYGNPFRMRDESERDSVCEQFEQWIEIHPEIVDRLAAQAVSLIHQHGFVRLVCFCVPKRCHGDTYVRLLKERGIE